MKQYYRFDANGNYVGPIIAAYTDENPQPEDVTEIKPPQPCWLPRFDGKKWIEDAPKPDALEGMEAVWDSEEKEWEIRPIPKPPKPPEQMTEELVDFLQGMYDRAGGESDG